MRLAATAGQHQDLSATHARHVSANVVLALSSGRKIMQRQLLADADTPTASAWAAWCLRAFGQVGFSICYGISDSKRYAGLPVVLTSGYADMVQTAEPQFVVLRKPFQLSAVEKAFREALEGQEREHRGGRVLPFSKPHGVDG